MHDKKLGRLVLRIAATGALSLGALAMGSAVVAGGVSVSGDTTTVTSVVALTAVSPSTAAQSEFGWD